MLKKSLTLITMLCAMVPMVASAASWSLATRVSTVGGTITSRNIAQTSANGTVFKTYTTQANLPVTIAANTGYAISAVSVNGVAQVIPYTGANPVQMGLTAYPTKSSQGVVVSFTAQTVMVPVTIAAAAGGTAIPVGTFNVKQGSTATVTFSPNQGNSVTSITNLPGGAVIKNAAGATVTLPYAGSVKVSFTVPAGGLNLTGNYGVALAASAGASSPAVINAAVTLTPSATVYSGGAASYAWTQLDGPVTATLTGTNPASFTPTVAGVYSFKVTATNSAGSSTATVTVPVTATAPATLTSLQIAKNQCVKCHTSAGVGTGIYANWSSSKHEANSIVCANCHVGADTGSHPGATVTSATCESCHAAALSKTTHPVAITASKCLVCHDPHDPAAGIANLGQAPAHPAVTLYTFEELGMQMAGGAKVPVQVDANGKGMPYSPKQTCGTSGCHVKNGIDYTYDKISDHAFHSNQGRSEYVDSTDGKLSALKNKPWGQSTAMVGKW